MFFCVCLTLLFFVFVCVPSPIARYASRIRSWWVARRKQPPKQRESEKLRLFLKSISIRTSFTYFIIKICNKLTLEVLHSGFLFDCQKLEPCRDLTLAHPDFELDLSQSSVFFTIQRTSQVLSVVSTVSDRYLLDII